MVGRTISHYRILDKLGEGGMGVVYKAEDTKLERTVALKFLAAHLLDDDEAKARFLREAKAAAALHHPNICTVHEIDEAEGKTFLAMAFLKGETLEERIAKGPLPLKDALDFCRQVAEGLEAAHAEGIVHRDIKPANVLISPEGRATIMDFGLARLTEASKLTQADQTVGTAAYMSPEQMQGAEVDYRTDVWALGCVLYEMVAGARAFQGEYAQALAYEIVNQAPEPLTGVRAGVPMDLEFIAGKCLEKDAASRYQNAGEITVDLRNLQDKLKSSRSTILGTASLAAGVPTTLTASRTLSPTEALPPGAVAIGKRRWQVVHGLAVVLGIALLGLLFVHLGEAPPEKPVRRFSFSPAGVFGRSVRISPDGKHILYAAQVDGRRSLWLRSLASESAREVAGTVGAFAGFWSPDSSSIGFGVEAPDFELKRLSINGVDPIKLCDLPSQSYAFAGGTWSPDGERIVFSSGLRLYGIPARGGEPKLLFEPGDVARNIAVRPYFLPADGKRERLVYTAMVSPTDSMLAVMDLETGERRELVPGRVPVYSPEGYLIYGPASALDGGLRALPFSLETLAQTGEAAPLDEFAGDHSISVDGTLVYSSYSSRGSSQVVVRSRAGEIEKTAGDPITSGGTPAVSPDGRFVALQIEGDIWVYNLDRDVETRITSGEGSEVSPGWLSSGREVSFTNGFRIMARVADGSMESKVLLDREAGLVYPSWSADGRYLIYNGSAGPTDEEGGIWYHERGDDGSLSEPVPFLVTADSENTPQFSRDSRYVAYSSNESGRLEVYVRPFPAGPGKWQVSNNGGAQPRWSADGKELFYVETTTLMAVPVSTQPSFKVEEPQRLFESEELRSSAADFWIWTYDVFPDGQRFVTLAPVEENETEPVRIHVVENWYEEFRTRERE